MKNINTNDFSFLNNLNVRTARRRGTLMRYKSFRFTRDNSLILRKFIINNRLRKKRFINKTTFHMNSIVYTSKYGNTKPFKRRVFLSRIPKPINNNLTRDNSNINTGLNYLSFLNSNTGLYKNINRTNELFSLVR